MPLNSCKLLLVCALSVATPALAADLSDQLAYCSYVMEQAQAQRDLLRTPIALAGLTQPETGLPTQLIAGASVGLSSIRKSGLTIEAARKNCELYKVTTGAQQDIQFGLPSLEK
jgi:hypothetical protein